MKIFQHRAKVSHKQRDLAVLKYLPPPPPLQKWLLFWSMVCSILVVSGSVILPVTVSAQAQDPCAGGGLQPSGPIKCEQYSSSGHFTLFIGEGTINGNSSPGVSVSMYHTQVANITLVSSRVDIITNGDLSSGIEAFKTNGPGDIGITVTGGSITTDGDQSRGIHGTHYRKGDIGITMTGGSITTMNINSDGIRSTKDRFPDSADGAGDGDIGITVTGGSITTKSNPSRAIYGYNGFKGDIAITVTDGKIRTEGRGNSQGIYAHHEGSGDIGITVTGGSITTAGKFSHGIDAHYEVTSAMLPVLEGSTGNIGISVTSGSITTVDESAYGLYAHHDITGNIGITVSGGSITTAGKFSHGILGWHEGTGDIGITVSEGSIATTGQTAHGTYGYHRDEGDIRITISEVSISTKSQGSHGIWGSHEDTGDIDITVSKGSITTTGQTAHGTYGYHRDEGDIRITISEGSITTEGQTAYGIYGVHGGTGDISISVSEGSITTEGQRSHGIYGRHISAKGNITIEVSEGSITTEGQRSHGISGLHQGTTGDITITVSGGRINTAGNDADGIYTFFSNATGDGKISITTGDGHTITTEGANARGIVVYNRGIGSSEVVVDNITAKGVGAYGIQFGYLNDDGEILSVPVVSVDDDGTRKLLDEDGYRPQMVRIKGTVMGGQAKEDEDGANGAGVFMVGGGRVEIGPEGVLGAQSDIAILAVGDNRTGEGTGEEPPQKLYVNLISTDGKPWERLDGRIVNEDGETILAVNGTNVFDNDHIDAWLPAGSLREFKLNPDEDFSTLDFSDEEDWLYRYQAIAGAYEALPGTLRRIDTIACHVPTQQNYIGVCGGRGQYTPDQTTTGMSYAYDQQALHGHIMRPLSEQVSGWAGLRQVSGEANVNIAAGSSRVKVRGVGVHGGVQVMGDTDLYGQAHLQWTRYTLNLSSGAVSSTTKGTAWSLGLEGGRHFRVDDETRVTGRGWLKHANVSVTPFEDSLGLRVSGQERQVIAGVGVRGERTMVQANEDRRVVLRGSAGIETAVSEASRVMVGDEVLSSQAKATRLLLDVGGVLHQGDTEFHGMVYAHGLGADDTAYGLRLGLEWSF